MASANAGELVVDLLFDSKGAVGQIGNLITKLGLLEFGFDRVQQGFDKMFGDSLKGAQGLKNLNTQTGFNIEQMQKWKSIAEQNGISLEDVLGSYKAIQENRTKMMMGGDMPLGYQVLGINPNQDPISLMDEVQAKLKGLDKDFQRNMLSSMGFSENMMIWFNISKKEMDSYNKSLDLNKSEIDQLTNLNKEWIGLTQDLGKGWDKTMAKISPYVKDIIAWFRELNATINDIIQSSDSVGEAFTRMFDALGKKFDEWAEDNKFIQFIVGMKDALYEVGEFLGETTAKGVIVAEKASNWIDDNNKKGGLLKRWFGSDNEKNENAVGVQPLGPLGSFMNNNTPPQASQNNKTIQITGDTNFTVHAESSNIGVDDVVEIQRQGNEQLINAVMANNQ